MKPIEQHRAGFHRAVCLALLAALWALGEASVSRGRAADDKDKKDVAAAAKDSGSGSSEAQPGEFSNSVTVGVGSYFVDGDKSQFMRQNRTTGGPLGGIEDFHMESQVGKKGLLQFDGHAMAGNHDYEFKFDLSQPEIGYLRGGFHEFRSWYDGSGGYTVRSNVWLSPYSDELHIDRQELWIQGGLTLPDWPVLTFSYAYQTRQGNKDSTIWGDYNLTPTASAAVARGVVPTFLGIDEHRNIFNADAKHTFGNTDVGIGMRYDASDIDNSRNILRRPGEAKVVRTVTQTDQTQADIMNAHGSTETRFNDRVMLTSGYSFTRLDTDIGGSRLYGPAYGSPFNPTYANRQRFDEGFFDLGGGSRSDQYVGNLNLMWNPCPNVALIPAVRFEHQEQYGIAFYTETLVPTTGGTMTKEDLINTRNRNFTDVTESLELRYTGVTNWAFYARGEWLQGQGTLSERETEAQDESLVDLERLTDSDRRVQKYTAGANWYPARKVSLGGQYYYKTRENDYDHLEDTAFFAPPATNNLYPAFIRNHEFDTHDVNFRITWRPWGNVTFISRYDYQFSTVDTRGDVNAYGIQLAKIQSSEATTHILSESISWSPVARLYLVGNISYVMDHTITPASDILGAATRLVQNADNDYWNTSLTSGVALSDKSDFQATYYYYRADNYSDNSSVGMAYGAGAEQHGVTATLIHRFRKNLIGKFQYGYFQGTDDTSGGNNNYDAHLVYSSLSYLF